jgi:hypothetical protein
LKDETVTPGSGNEPHTWLSRLPLRRLDSAEIQLLMLLNQNKQFKAAMCEALRRLELLVSW